MLDSGLLYSNILAVHILIYSAIGKRRLAFIN